MLRLFQYARKCEYISIAAVNRIDDHIRLDLLIKFLFQELLFKLPIFIIYYDNKHLYNKHAIRFLPLLMMPHFTFTLL